MKLQGKSLDTLTELQRHNLEASIVPQGAFTDSQRQLLSGHLLRVTQPQLDALNAAAKGLCIVSAREAVDGKLYISSDILSDAVHGRRLTNLLPILSQLVIEEAAGVTFPQPEVEDYL
jgi:hypothetical protein